MERDKHDWQWKDKDRRRLRISFGQGNVGTGGTHGMNNLLPTEWKQRYAGGYVRSCEVTHAGLCMVDFCR